MRLALPRCRARLAEDAALRITAFGSSTTEGIGASGPEAGYVGVLGRALRRRLPHRAADPVLRNRGVGGHNAVDLHARLDEVIADAPDLVLFQTGSNDPLQAVPLAMFDRLTREDLDRLRAASGADIVLIDQQYCRVLEECPAFPPFLAGLRAIGEQTAIARFPRYRLMRHWCARPGWSRDRLSPDGLHMADEGYALLGEALSAWLSGALVG